jgi:hypothetical protein
MGIDVTDAQGLAVVGCEGDRLARLEPGQGGRGHIHLIAVNPQVTGAKAAVFVLPET